MEKLERDELYDVMVEYKRAVELYPPYNTPHEGFAVLLEEVHELWDLVRLKEDARPKKLMYNEASQIAAVAIRFMKDCCK